MVWARPPATYAPLTDNAVYSKDADAAYPLQDIQTPVYVVAAVAMSNGVGGSNRATYRYEGAKVDLSGRGLLGFRQMQEVDLDTGIQTITVYRQDFPYIGMIKQSTSTVQSTGVVLSSVVNTWAKHPTLAATASSGGVYFPYVARSVVTAKDLNGAYISTTTTDNPVLDASGNLNHDAYGNPIQITVSTVDALSPSLPYTKTTTSLYDNDVSAWHLGRLRRAQVTSRLPGGASAARTSTFAYYPGSGLLQAEEIEPYDPALRLRTEYGYDAFGNKTTVTVSGDDITPRTTTTSYGPDGRFPVWVSNALSHNETRAYDARFGAMTRLTGPNNLSTFWSYDAFGRILTETRADGTRTLTDYVLCTGNCPPLAVYSLTTKEPIGDGTTSLSPMVTVYYDTLNRPVRSVTQHFAGTQRISTDTRYNAMGQVEYISKPYFITDITTGTPAGTPGTLTRPQDYDILNRPLLVSAPDGGITRLIYTGLKTQTLQYTGIPGSMPQVSTQFKNSQGQLTRSVDALGGDNLYYYDPFGNLTLTLDADRNDTRLQYDSRGRKIAMIDPDMGTWFYKYNVLDELIWQKDAKGQVTTMTYDLLGRMKTRTEPQANGSLGTSTWSYDGGATAIGKLTLVSGPNGYLRTLDL